MKCHFETIADAVKQITLGEKCADEPWSPKRCVEEFFDGDYAKFLVRLEDFDWDTFLEFGRDLARNGVASLPYTHCYLQIDGLEIDSDTYKGPAICGLFLKDLTTEGLFAFAAWRWMFYRDGKTININTAALNSPAFFKYDPAKMLRDTGMIMDATAEFPRWGVDLWGPEYCNVILSLCTWFVGIINSRTYKIDTHTPSPKLNRARAKRGVSPLPEYHVITIDMSQVTRSSVESDSSHASPRPHWRRGHVRRLPNGSKTIVRPHAVMGGSSSLPQYRFKT